MIGIDSGNYAVAERYGLWQRMSQRLPLDKLATITTEASLGDLPQLGEDILSGKVKGRVVIDVNK